MKKEYWFLFKVLLLFIALVVSGLTRPVDAAIPDRYNIDIRPGVKQTDIPAHLKAREKARRILISVAEFTDERQVADKQIIGHVREIGDTKVPVYARRVSVTLAVAEGVRDYLKKAGYKVADKVMAWDLKEGTVPKGSGKAIISGSIEELNVTCWTGVFSNDYKINLKLNLVVADAVKGKILYKGNVAVSYSKTDVSFSEKQLGDEAGLALDDALGKIFEGKMVAKKIREAVAQ